MQVHRNIDQLPLFRNAVITIGTFDGVHMGHRQIIEKLKQEAEKINGETVIITFHPHPRKIVSAGASAVRLINTTAEKTALLEALAVDHLVIIPFTESFANQTAEEYIAHFLVEKFHPHTIIIGYDHRFGKNRSGDYLLLEQKAPVYDYVLKEIPKHVLDEIAISSTKIRESIQQGRIEIADRLLGYEFFFDGTVVTGDKLGRKLGYPTANLVLEDPEKLIPGDGVYAVHVRLREPDSDLFKGMMSIGFRPTVDGTKRAIEVNIFDFDREIYGSVLRVFVKKYLRPQIRFKSLEELVRQIDQDKTESLAVL